MADVRIRITRNDADIALKVMEDVDLSTSAAVREIIRDFPAYKEMVEDSVGFLNELFAINIDQAKKIMKKLDEKKAEMLGEHVKKLEQEFDESPEKCVAGKIELYDSLRNSLWSYRESHIKSQANALVQTASERESKKVQEIEIINKDKKVLEQKLEAASTTVTSLLIAMMFLIIVWIASMLVILP